MSYVAAPKRTSKLDSLSADERKELIARLYKKQNGLCYVDRQAVNLHVHAVDVDHVIALARGGADWQLHLQSRRIGGTFF